MDRRTSTAIAALAFAGLAWCGPAAAQRIAPLARGVSGPSGPSAVSDQEAAAIRKALAKAEAEDRAIAEALAEAAAEDRAATKAAAKAAAHDRAIAKALAEAEAEDSAATKVAAKAAAHDREIAKALAEAEAEDRAKEDAESQGSQPTSEAAVRVANWVVASHDNQALPFIVIDKAAAAVLVFGTAGEFLGAAPTLLGITVGDESTPGVGDRELNQIPIEERTTPAGRFAARYGPAAGGKRVLWVDFSTSLALHPVVTANRKERRLQRINSPTVEDNRITFGCINVPTAFYSEIVQPLFEETGGIVYILPETQPLEFVFPRLPAQSSAPLRVAL